MTKNELILALATQSEMSRARAEMIVNCVFHAMTETLQRGDGIEIRGFGSFALRSYQGYIGRNPRTGARVEVPSKKLPFFKAGKELRRMVDEGAKAAVST